MKDVLDITPRLERIDLHCEDCATDYVARRVGLCPVCGSRRIVLKDEHEERVIGWRAG